MIRLFTTIALLTALYSPPVVAQQMCGIHTSMIVTLNMNYGEIRHGWGLSGSRVLVELWANDETGTWTILMVYPNGVACVRAVGKSWTVVRHEIAGDDT